MVLNDEQTERLQKKLNEFEELRINELRRLKNYNRIVRPFKYIYWAALITGLLSGIIPFLLPISVPIIILAISLYIIQLVLYYKVYKKPGEEFDAKFKETIMRLAFELINPKLKYNPYSGFSNSTIQSMHLFTQNIESQYTEDYCEGSMLGVDLRFCEAWLESTRRTKTTVSLGCLMALIGLFQSGEGELKTSETYQFFQGLLVQLDFHKSFNGRVYAIPKNTYVKKLSNMGNYQGAKPTTSGYPEFDSYYNVFTTNEVLLHYVITPSMAQRINTMREKHKADISLSFLNGKLNMAVGWNKDLFELSIYKGVPSIDDFKLLADEIEIFEEILKDLNQDRRIWGEKALS